MRTACRFGALIRSYLVGCRGGQPSSSLPFAVLVSALLVCLSVLECNAEDPAGWIHKKVEFEDPLPPGMPVKVVNLYGDVRVKGIVDDHLPVFGILQKRNDTAFDPRVEIKHCDDVSTVTVLAGGAENEIEGSVTSRELGFRVDLTVFIPPASDVSVETRNGLIKIKGVKRDVFAKSVMGGIEISTPGSVRAETRGGDMLVAFKPCKQPSRSDLKTLTGDVSVVFPRPVDVVAALRTSGTISTDFSIDIEKQIDSRFKTAKVRISESSSGARGCLHRTIRRILNPFRNLSHVVVESNLGAISLRAPATEWKKAKRNGE